MTTNGTMDCVKAFEELILDALKKLKQLSKEDK